MPQAVGQHTRPHAFDHPQSKAFLTFTGVTIPDDPQQAVQHLRSAIAAELDRMDFLISVLDALDGDTDLEPSFCGVFVDRPACGPDEIEEDHDFEKDDAEAGIGESVGIAELSLWSCEVAE